MNEGEKLRTQKRHQLEELDQNIKNLLAQRETEIDSIKKEELYGKAKELASQANAIIRAIWPSEYFDRKWEL